MRILWPDGTPDVGERAPANSTARSGPVSQIPSAVGWAVGIMRNQESGEAACCAVCGNVMHKQFIRRWNEQDACLVCIGEMTQDYPEGGEHIGRKATN
jgi:hypothetical protein